MPIVAGLVLSVGSYALYKKLKKTNSHEQNLRDKIANYSGSGEIMFSENDASVIEEIIRILSKLPEFNFSNKKTNKEKFSVEDYDNFSKKITNIIVDKNDIPNNINKIIIDGSDIYQNNYTDLNPLSDLILDLKEICQVQVVFDTSIYFILNLNDEDISKKLSEVVKLSILPTRENAKEAINKTSLLDTCYILSNDDLSQCHEKNTIIKYITF